MHRLYSVNENTVWHVLYAMIGYFAFRSTLHIMYNGVVRRDGKGLDGVSIGLFLPLSPQKKFSIPVGERVIGYSLPQNFPEI